MSMEHRANLVVWDNCQCKGICYTAPLGYAESKYIKVMYNITSFSYIKVMYNIISDCLLE